MSTFRGKTQHGLGNKTLVVISVGWCLPGRWVKAQISEQMERQKPSYTTCSRRCTSEEESDKTLVQHIHPPVCEARHALAARHPADDGLE